MKKSINEEQLKNIIRPMVKEGLMDKLRDFNRGYEIKDGEPESIEDVFEGDGWKVNLKKEGKTGTLYSVSRMTGSFGHFEGQDPEDMVDELNTFLKGNGNAIYVGPNPKARGNEVFRIEHIQDDNMDNDEPGLANDEMGAAYDTGNLQERINKIVSQVLKEAMEIPQEDDEEDEILPESLAESLIKAVDEFMANKDPNTRSMRMAIDPECVKKNKENASNLYDWMNREQNKYHFTSEDAFLKHVFGKMKFGGRPSPSFAKNYFTKEAQARYFSKNDMSHHNDAEKQREVANDPTRMKTPRPGRYMANKMAKINAASEPAGIE